MLYYMWNTNSYYEMKWLHIGFKIYSGTFITAKLSSGVSVAQWEIYIFVCKKKQKPIRCCTEFLFYKWEDFHCYSKNVLSMFCQPQAMVRRLTQRHHVAEKCVRGYIKQLDLYLAKALCFCWLLTYWGYLPKLSLIKLVWADTDLVLIKPRPMPELAAL